MHMADALLSPAVGATMWAGSVAAIGYSSKKLKENIDNKTIPLMGVMGRLSCAQMIKLHHFPSQVPADIIGGGNAFGCSSGSLRRYFWPMGLDIDGSWRCLCRRGLLALGCNIWYMGIYPCFLVLSPDLQTMLPETEKAPEVSVAAITWRNRCPALGAFSVVLETLFSGISELPFGTFVLADAAGFIWPSALVDGNHHGRHHPCMCNRPAGNSSCPCRRPSPGCRSFHQEHSCSICDYGGHYRRLAFLVCLNASDGHGVVH